MLHHGRGLAHDDVGVVTALDTRRPVPIGGLDIVLPELRRLGDVGVGADDAFEHCSHVRTPVRGLPRDTAGYHEPGA